MVICNQDANQLFLAHDASFSPAVVWEDRSTARGTIAVTCVPCPGWLTIVKWPPKLWIRSRIPTRPKPSPLCSSEVLAIIYK
jgi:hypothetical protein